MHAKPWRKHVRKKMNRREQNKYNARQKSDCNKNQSKYYTKWFLRTDKENLQQKCARKDVGSDWTRMFLNVAWNDTKLAKF